MFHDRHVIHVPSLRMSYRYMLMKAKETREKAAADKLAVARRMSKPRRGDGDSTDKHKP